VLATGPMEAYLGEKRGQLKRGMKPSQTRAWTGPPRFQGRSWSQPGLDLRRCRRRWRRRRVVTVPVTRISEFPFVLR
jgi:hypothetical protein